MPEVGGDGSGLRDGEGITHRIADDGPADQHGGSRRQAAQHKGHHRGVDAPVVEQAVHRRLAAGQLVAALHHTLQIGDAVQHRQGIQGVVADGALLDGRQHDIHRRLIQHDDDHAGNGHNQVQRALEGQQRDDDGEDNPQLDQ